MVADEARDAGLHSNDEREVRELYQSLLTAWNRREAGEMADLFIADGSIVGFDGSQHVGSVDIETDLGRIFAMHATPSFVAIVREVRILTPGAALLWAVAGLVPSGRTDLDPAGNSIQSLVAVRQHHRWRIAHYQATPAAFHGRPEEAAKLTDELRREIRR